MTVQTQTQTRTQTERYQLDTVYKPLGIRPVRWRDNSLPPDDWHVSPVPWPSPQDWQHHNNSCQSLTHSPTHWQHNNDSCQSLTHSLTHWHHNNSCQSLTHSLTHSFSYTQLLYSADNWTTGVESGVWGPDPQKKNVEGVRVCFDLPLKCDILSFKTVVG